MSGYVGRLAPSPTGALHLGNARTFMIAWLGFDWDEEYVQSERRAVYRAALARLDAYPCICSRKDVACAQSAPHAGEQLFYPGTCRGRFASWDAAAAACAPRTPCWRFRVPEGTVVRFDDVFVGAYEQDVSRTLGDFPLARDPDGAGYTLAATVDDLLMGVTEVVRGDDLLPATPPQILLARQLGRRPPAYCHVPLVVGPDGRRLAKRHGDTRLAAFRAAGVSPETVVGWLAHTCGWNAKKEPIRLQSLIGHSPLETVPREAVVWGGSFT